MKPLNNWLNVDKTSLNAENIERVIFRSPRKALSLSDKKKYINLLEKGFPHQTQ